MSRARNATRNIVFGILLRIYQIFIPFLMRTAMIYLMGVEYLGLNSLFSSVLQVLNLAELGVGSAMVYSMYKPIAQKNKTEICALLKLYKRYYFLIGLIIAIIGCAITPFIPRFIKGEIPGSLNVYVLYLLNLSATVLTYWLFAYKNSLLQAHERNDLSSKVMLITNTIQYVLQLLVLWIFHNYYYYIIVMLLTTTLSNIITAVVASKYYPEYVAVGELPKSQKKEINRKIRDLFTAKLGSTVVNSADTIVISTFLGLTVLAIYQNYYFIMSSVVNIISIIFASCLAGIGNSLIKENIQKNYMDFRIITLFINMIVTVCMACFATMYQPFITLWVGHNFTFENSFVWLLCIYFYLVVMQQIPGMYKDAAGVWHQDRYRPLIASAVNLILNIVLVKYWGIYAIVLSTIVSYLTVAVPWLIANLFHYVFSRDWKDYVVDMIKYFICTLIITSLCYVTCMLTSGLTVIMQLILNGLISVVCSSTLWILVYRKSRYFKAMIKLVDRVTHKKIQPLLFKLLPNSERNEI